MRPTIQLSTGGYFSFESCTSSDIRIQDIAHALSNACRFAGHTKKFYSVAQHSVIVSCIVPEEFALVGLLHDATEAYIGDMTRPLKNLNPTFCELEHKIWTVIADRYGLSYEIPSIVKRADNIALVTEKRDLMPRDKDGSEEWSWTRGIMPLKDRIIPLQPAAAERSFKNRWLELTGEKI